MSSKIKNRSGIIISKNETQNSMLSYIYGSVIGNVLLKVLTKPAITKIAGDFCNLGFSRIFIKPFIKKSGIDMKQYQKCKYKSYNDFFTRKIKSEYRTINMDNNTLISPCDSKLSVYKISSDSQFMIKGAYYSTASLLRCSKLANKYNDGYCMIFRLEVDDYHRYIYIDKGSKSANMHIPGIYHTVNPIALQKVNFYKENSREFTILHTQNFGDIVQIEVGAMMVGKISNHHQKHCFKRGDEKGTFEFGGSTIVLLVSKNTVNIDSDILENSREGFETQVKLGEKIGIKII